MIELMHNSRKPTTLKSPFPIGRLTMNMIEDKKENMIGLSQFTNGYEMKDLKLIGEGCHPSTM